MNWNTDTISSTFDVTSGTTNMSNERGAQRSGSSVGTHSTGFLGLGGKESNLPSSSIVGINVNEIKPMLDAIEYYCQNIQTYVSGLQPAADATIAFKSQEVNKALTEYMEQVKKYCVNLVSQLQAFSDKLVDVKNQWEIATQNMASNIVNTSGSFATGSQYNPNIQQ